MEEVVPKEKEELYTSYSSDEENISFKDIHNYNFDFSEEQKKPKEDEIMEKITDLECEISEVKDMVSNIENMLQEIMSHLEI